MEQTKAFIHEYFHALSGQPKTAELIRRFVSDAALIEHIEQIEAAFPGYDLIVQDMVVEGDKAAVRAEFRGEHRGAFAGFAPTGAQVKAGLIIIYRIAEGRVAEHWLQFDSMGLVQQLQAAK